MRWGLFVLVLLCLLFFWFLRAVYQTALRGPGEKAKEAPLPQGEQYRAYRPRMQALVEEMQDLPFEAVDIRAEDGTRLHARYLHVRDNAPVMIQVHGYRSNGIRDFCGGNKIAREHDINTLVVDQRAHGESGDRTIAFGVRERYDVQAWANYAAERFGPETKILLSGISLGAASVLMAADLPLPENVVGIIADCPYTSPEAIIRKVIRQNRVSDTVFFPFVQMAARLFGGGLNLKEASAAASVRQTKIPILLLHGTEDHFVPASMSEEIFDACASEAELELFAGAAHGISYLVDPERYTDRVLAFVQKVTTLV